MEDAGLVNRVASPSSINNPGSTAFGHIYENTTNNLFYMKKSDGTSVLIGGGGGGYPIFTKTVAQLQALVGSFDVNVRYLITDAYGGKLSYLATVYDSSTLGSTGTGVFKNDIMVDPVVVGATYDIVTNTIRELYEPTNNNVVKGASFFSMLLQFRFDDPLQQNNTFNECRFLNVNPLATFNGCYYTKSARQFNNHLGAFINDSFMGVLDANSSSSLFDLVLVGDIDEFGCNNYWGNDQGNQIDNVGAGADMEYNSFGSSSSLDVQAHTGLIFNSVTLGPSTTALIEANSVQVRQTEIFNGTVYIGGNTTFNTLKNCNVRKFMGNRNTINNLIKIGAVNAVQIDDNNLNKVTILNEGTGCVVSGSIAIGSTIDFAGFNNCTFTGMNSTKTTHTFTGNGQTKQNELWVNNQQVTIP